MIIFVDRPGDDAVVIALGTIVFLRNWIPPDSNS